MGSADLLLGLVLRVDVELGEQRVVQIVAHVIPVQLLLCAPAQRRQETVSGVQEEEVRRRQWGRGGGWSSADWS